MPQLELLNPWCCGSSSTVSAFLRISLSGVHPPGASETLLILFLKTEHPLEPLLYALVLLWLER